MIGALDFYTFYALAERAAESEGAICTTGMVPVMTDCMTCSAAAAVGLPVLVARSCMLFGATRVHYTVCQDLLAERSALQSLQE
jgi:hypothetical protein